MRALVQAPLFLSMLVVTDQMAPGELQKLQGTSDTQDLLIEIYIRERIERANSYTPRQMKFWLVWLAQQMERESQTEFLIEKMQPSWLPERLRQILYQNGYIPWNYARFLNRCTDALVLQRIGGRVRFIHKTVQDHFAQMDFERP